MSLLACNSKILLNRLPVISFISQFHVSVQCDVQAKALKKLLGGGSKKKRHYAETPTLPTAEGFSRGAYEGNRSTNSRRVSVLNKLFMRHITELMLTGEKASEFSGLGIEINRVKISPDFRLVQVFWVGKGTQADTTIEDVLFRNAPSLRHELTQLRVIGMVPKIKFFKDKLFTNLVDLDARLQIADYGDDYTPMDSAERLKTQLELQYSLDAATKEKIERSEEETLGETVEEPLPPMPHDVFGLHHDRILLRVKQALKKSRAPHRSEIADREWAPSLPVMEGPMQTEESQKEAFRKFLAQRQVLKKKLAAEEKNYSPDLEYIREELEERYKQNFERFFVDDESETEEDFMDENEEVK